MKNLFRLSLLVLALGSLNAQASFAIKSVELIDSTMIDGSQVSAITIHDNDSSVESIETTDGSIIHGSFIKRLNLSSEFKSIHNVQTASRVGGEGTGG